MSLLYSTEERFLRQKKNILIYNALTLSWNQHAVLLFQILVFLALQNILLNSPIFSNVEIIQKCIVGVEYAAI